MGVVFGQNMYEHVGGEVRWLYQFGGPELKSQGVETSSTGYSNLVTYDLLFHMSAPGSQTAAVRGRRSGH